MNIIINNINYITYNLDISMYSTNNIMYSIVNIIHNIHYIMVNAAADGTCRSIQTVNYGLGPLSDKHLQIVKLPVFAVVVKKLGVLAALDDDALLQHNNFIGMFNC
jgi:hypothetical protein